MAVALAALEILPVQDVGADVAAAAVDVYVFHLFISLFLLFHVNRDCGTIYILFI